MQRECNYCDNHQQVNMEKDQASGKWVVTNLDGSYHKHVKLGGYQQQASIPSSNTVTRTEQQQQRSEAIAQAHQDNMEANDKLRSAIQGLTDKLTDLEKLFQRYLEITTA